MYNISLARKYRPKLFSDVIAQSHIINIIKSSIKSKKLYCSYIFYGIRGIGKTTLGRIVAKTINCENITNSIEPCLHCLQCLMLDENRHQDIHEIDAAGHSGVINIRNIIDNFKYKPILSRYKILIIDEVHMLSYSAFNALLKILEEPPYYARFILITTELNRVPLTIKSRCYKFHLSRIRTRYLAFFLQKIAIKENINIDFKSLFIIAKASQGIIRDSIIILNQAIIMCKYQSIDVYLLEKMLGIVYIQYIYKIFILISMGKFKCTINIVRKLYLKGIEALVILQNLIEICYKLSLFKISCKSITLSNYELFQCKKINFYFSIIGLIRFWKILNKSLIEIKNFYNPILSLEMLIIQISSAKFLFNNFSFY